MKKVEHYICEICGTEYNNRRKCQLCETGHVKPTGIVGARFLPIENNKTGYPDRVHIKMRNGETITYHR